MATPITWQSISKPDFDSVNKGLLQTAALFSNAFDGFKDTLKESNATVEQNWKQGKENNTNALLNKFAGFKTAEEAQAALESGAVAEMLGGYGAQVDGSAVRTAQQNLVSNLQKKAIEADTYQQAQLAAQERDPIGAVRARIAVGDYKGANNLMAESPLSKNTQALLSKDIFNHQQVVAEAKEKRDAAASTLLTQEAQRKHWEATSEAQRAQVNATQTRAEADLEKAKAAIVKSVQTAVEKDKKEDPISGMGYLGDEGTSKLIDQLLEQRFPKNPESQNKVRSAIAERFKDNLITYIDPNTGKKVQTPVPISGVMAKVDEALLADGVNFSVPGLIYNFNWVLNNRLKDLSTDGAYAAKVAESIRKQSENRNRLSTAISYGAEDNPPKPAKLEK